MAETARPATGYEAGRLAGRSAVVTGAAQGIGLGVTRALLESGASVAMLGRTDGKLRAAAEELSGLGRTLPLAVDVGDREAVEAAFSTAAEAHGDPDILVCCHGVIGNAPFLELGQQQWEETLRANLTGVFNCGQVAARRMVAAAASTGTDPGGRSEGRIVLCGSPAGIRADKGSADYSASKAGVHLLGKAMAVELAEHGITVNIVVPGFIMTPMSEPYAAGLTDEDGRFVLNPVGRVGRPADIAGAVLWLVDSAGDFVTGQLITVDGGESAVLHQAFL